MSKLAIVASEGGMRCAYSVGAILALVEKYDLKKPDFVIGASGSTGTLAYYVSGQYKSIKNIWENLLSTKKFVSFLRLSRIIDIDYLIDEVFKKQDPLDVATIKSSATKLYMIVTNKQTGKAVWLSQNDGDIFEILRASNAIPGFFNKEVAWHGQTLIDGAISFHLEDGIQLAKKLGADKIIAIENRNTSFISWVTYNLYAFFQNKNVRQSMLRKRQGFTNDPAVFLIKSPNSLPLSTLDNNQARIKESIRMGYHQVAQNENLASFLRYT